MPTIDLQVSSSPNDGRSTTAVNSSYSSTASRLLIGTQNTPRIWGSWYRWIGVIGLLDATVTVAFISLVENFGEGGTILTKIHAENAAAPSAPTNQADFTARVRTAAGTDWDGINLDPVTFTDSPSIVAVIQEITVLDPTVIQVLHDDDNGDTSANNWVRPQSYDGDTAEAAKIHIEFSAGEDLVKALADTLAIADAISKGVGTIRADAFALADSVGKTPGLFKSDTMSIVDSGVLQICRLLRLGRARLVVNRMAVARLPILRYFTRRW